MEHRASKCSAAAGRWQGKGTGEEMVDMAGEVVLENEYRGTAEEVPRVGVASDQKALGVQVSMAGYTEGAVAEASAEGVGAAAGGDALVCAVGWLCGCAG
jgi:hypothetical protein